MLQKVVAIQPDRLVAWRNLADAVSATLATPQSLEDKSRLIRIDHEANGAER